MLHHVTVDRSTRTVTPSKSYSAHHSSAFDIIVVDGRLRREATALAFSYLAPGGAMLLDDSRIRLLRGDERS